MKELFEGHAVYPKNHKQYFADTIVVPYRITSYELLFALCIFLLFIYFYFLAALGVHCCPQAFSSCGERGLLLVAVHGLLIAVASLVAEHGL